jgi:poly-gamma-glutamate capsule biosynthesis protein CapA/YwtB (metallophosphatase superfamily)
MRRESGTTYWIRRLVAILVLAGVVAVVAAVIVPAFDGADDDAAPPGEAQVADGEEGESEPEPEPVRLMVSVSGDVLIHSPVWAQALALGGGQTYDFAPMFAELRPYVEGVDLALCHLETPMTPDPPASYPVFNTPPELAEAVAASGWDACSTASNHSVDQGEEGIVETGKALDRAGVRHTGTFTSPSARRRPLILDVDGARIAYLSYTTDTNGIPVPQPWMVNMAEPDRIVADARRARQEGADAVIVNIHWGGGIVAEYSPEPSEGQIELVERLTASPDITAVVGQGPHVVQPIRRINGKYVVFSEGNLVSNQGAAVGLPEASQDGFVGLLDLVVDTEEGTARVSDVSYVPIWVSQPDYTVLPVGDALADGQADPAALTASYERTVSVTGESGGVKPEPERLR